MRPSGNPSFSILVVTLILMIIGGLLVPRLPVHLVSTRTGTALTVSWSWPDSSPWLVEQEVTAPLEGLLNTIRGVTKIRSASNTGGGSITLEFDKQADYDAMRFEVAGKIRELYPRLPDRVSYPRISGYTDAGQEKTLLAYTLNAPANPRTIQEYAEDRLVPALAGIPGLYRTDVYGATPMEWELEFSQEQLRQVGLTRDRISSAIVDCFRNEVIGLGWEQNGDIGREAPEPVILRTEDGQHCSWQDIPVAFTGGRMFRIRDLCTIRYREQEPSGYYRINGDNTVYLVFTAEKEANSLKVASRIKQELSLLEKTFPAGYSLLLQNDSTEYIRAEISKIVRRTVISFAILMLFVLLVSRRLRYLLVIFLSLIANLLLSVILYYAFRMEINLYSMTGITVSLGMIIDNTIVMVDHLRTKGNRNVFIAVLAATLTTVGALSVIRFLGETTRMQLADFSCVLIASLSVSLAVALFLVPALTELVGLKRLARRSRTRDLRRAVRFGRYYAIHLAFTQRFRWAFIVVAILLFGLPVHKLPTRMEGEEWYHKLYRATFAGETYVQKIKPLADKVLGGTLRIFTTRITQRYRYREPERTAINVGMKLPPGATLDQMNDLAFEVERYLKQYEQVDRFTTRISDARNGFIRITFKPEFEQGAFPYILYSQLLSLANLLTGADWNIAGVGDYFSNAAGESVGDQQITLYGYNFEDLNAYARELMQKIREHPRSTEPCLIAETERWGMRDLLYEYRLSMDPVKLKARRLTPAEAYAGLRDYSVRKSSDGSVMVNGKLGPFRLKSTESDRFDIWMMYHTPIGEDGKLNRLSELGTLTREHSNKSITRENQQYVITVAYRFQGAQRLASEHRERVIAEMAAKVPVGYYIRDAGYYWWQKEQKRLFLLILLVIVIIYAITAILLESLIQPLAVILIIPVSFTGVFLTFYVFDLGLDQGAFASFILLTGIVVNAALYILNDYNNGLRRPRNSAGRLKLYLKAYQGKIVPITLTVMSTVLGLVPFITEGEDEVFWFSLAAGTVGGLIFSFFAIIVFLPAFLPLGKSNHKTLKP